MNDDPISISIPNLDGSFFMNLHEEQELVSGIIRKSGTYEPVETQLVISSLNEGDRFVDVGANIGWYTIIASKKVGQSGNVLAFEPDPRNFELLKQNCELNDLPNVVLINKALSDKSSSEFLYRSPTNFGDHRLYASGEDREKVVVATLTLDSFIEGRGLKNIQTIKIDTQGSEPKILRGMQRYIQGEKPVIFLEFWPYGIYKNQESVFDILAFIEKNGYEVYQIRNGAPFHLSVGLLFELSRERLHKSRKGYIDLILFQRSHMRLFE